MRMKNMTDQEINTSIREMEAIIMEGKNNCIQKLAMMKATDDNIIYELRLLNKQFKWLAIWGWSVAGLTIAGLSYLT